MASNPNAYTTGSNPNLMHRRLIGTGGFGSVHEVDSRFECWLIDYSSMTFLTDACVISPASLT